MVSRIAVIPARGGSKRIPKKNIMDFCGKPMIAWTIEAALESDQFDYVMVSTEDPSIADIAREFGAQIPFMRDSHFDDHSTVSDAVVASVIKIQKEKQCQFHTVAQLMANCPNRTSKDIRDAISNFDGGPHDFQLSCFEFGWMNPWWAATLDRDGVPTPLFPEALKSRSQDLQTLFCPTGAIWLANTQALIDSKTFYGPDYRFFPMPWMSAVDIDDYSDFDLANAVMHMKKDDTLHSH